MHYDFNFPTPESIRRQFAGVLAEHQRTMAAAMPFLRQQEQVTARITETYRPYLQQHQEMMQRFARLFRLPPS